MEAKINIDELDFNHIDKMEFNEDYVLSIDSYDRGEFIRAWITHDSNKPGAIAFNLTKEDALFLGKSLITMAKIIKKCK